MQALRALQEIDRHLFRVREELKRLPLERDRRQAKLDARHSRIEGARENVRQLQVKAKELEDTATVQRQRIRKLERESNSQRDMAVIEACRYEMRSLKRQIDEAERETLELMERIELEQGRINTAQTELDEELRLFAEYCENVVAELGDAQSRHDDLEAKRQARMSENISQETLSLYDKLLEARDGEALAILDSGVCQSCYISVPPNLVVRLARGLEITQCPNCNRIMYLD